MGNNSSSSSKSMSPRRDQIEDDAILQRLFVLSHNAVAFGENMKPMPHGCALSRFTVLHTRPSHSTPSLPSRFNNWLFAHKQQHHDGEADGEEQEGNQDFAEDSVEWKKVQAWLLNRNDTPPAHTLTPQQDRAIGALLGLAIGDALGAPQEFLPVRYDQVSIRDFSDARFFFPFPLNNSNKTNLNDRSSNKKNGDDDECDDDHDDHQHDQGVRKYNKFLLQSGQWTDDCSLALCMAESLLLHQRLHLRDMRLRFLNWWRFGYCNAFGWDTSHYGSVGLGGNIGSSLREFVECDGKTERTTAGNKATSGNGSLMRLAPVSIFFSNDVNTAMDSAEASSFSTHQGVEAAECCRLLAFLCVHAINMTDAPSSFSSSSTSSSSSSSSSTSSSSSATTNSDSDASNHHHQQQEQQNEQRQSERNKHELLTTVISRFSSSLYSVTCLARSQQEQPHAENEWMRSKGRALHSDKRNLNSTNNNNNNNDDNKIESSDSSSSSCPTSSSLSSCNTANESVADDDSYLVDRNWNWRVASYRYSQRRANSQPGYVGSYAMDALCMALHIVWCTSSCAEAIVRAANLRGDSDTVAAITGQLAGAIYGGRGCRRRRAAADEKEEIETDGMPVSWIRAVQNWERPAGRMAFTAYVLYEKQNMDALLKPAVKRWRNAERRRQQQEEAEEQQQEEEQTTSTLTHE